jgi:hypothetical protein
LTVGIRELLGRAKSIKAHSEGHTLLGPPASRRL